MILFPSPCGRRWRAAPDEGAGEASLKLDAGGFAHRLKIDARGFARTLTQTPAPRPGPRWRRGRSKARAPVARKPRLLAP
ncbi:hypothetical protein CFBP8129_24150 [Xanthomonas hortorum pv. gardneri]|uniref:Uncharacterized protein n=1 Tax=Xanthomonas hortorum pv. gardneri TaxID=2754056 RepID=A0A6V7DIE7_9XANT|nr:hypothetical protein BJD10_13140 [Xanthomonas hortorum pv. gardneri]PPU48930.1 hypothetical protein XcyCFBP4188_03105 [Xanthomonas hortorum pv. cynarae]CAH2708276.1 hypothetical protein NCPPB1935_10965 [Xanthomonas campestris pv. nigromaculans]CAD0331851.1 hypothetical protein CFBP2044_22420 [Xanthomonas hortorum pv. cynarae]CAD0331860.1 hypothetical protein CFBP2044_22420 [Xanthomonas hortorum pv. cynarae]